MPISALPPAPQPTDSPSQFNTKAFAFLAALSTFRTEANAVETAVDADASTASTAAGTATTKANEALASANAAAQSAIDANGAAVSAINAFDQFDDRYLGPKASNPTLDNDGNALLTGALYWNTSVPEMRVWTGSAWQVAAGSIQANLTIIREVQTAGSGQTIFNLSNTYTPGLNTLMVYRNGARLLNSEYTETNANTVTLAAAATLNDELLFEIGVVSTGPTSTAGATSFNPAGNIAATNVQAAIAELDSEKVAATGGTASGLTLNDGYTEEIFSVTGTTPALSPTNGSVQTWTLTGASTPTAGTWANGQSITLLIDDGTANTINWSSVAVTWKTNGGSAPTLLTTGLTVIQLWKVGDVVYGARVGDA